MAGLFGGQKRGFDPSVIGNLLLGSNEVARRRVLQDDEQQRRAAQEQQRQSAALADRLRAQLSPMDGPSGSGTGAAPSVEQQMAALNEARLLNPAVAEQFSPYVQGNRLREMTQGLPLAQQLAIELNPERAGQSFATQFEDMPLAAGTIRSRGSETVAAAPRVERFDDRFGAYDLMSGTTTYSQPRGPTFQEQTGRVTAERPQIANLGQGQQAFGVDPYGGVTPLAQNTAPLPPSAQEVELRGQYDTNTNEVIPTLTQMRQMVESGDVITGLGADVRLQAARALAATGNDQARRQVAATEAYRNMSGRLRVGMAKTLGANPSNADIKLLEQVTAGDIGQNSQSLLATIDQGLAFANQRNSALSQQMGQGQSSQQSGGSGPIAVNPRTGQRVQWSGQQWVPIQ